MSATDADIQEIIQSNIKEASELSKDRAKFSTSTTETENKTNPERFDDLNSEQISGMNKVAPKSSKQRLVIRIKNILDRARLKTRQGLVDTYAALYELDKKAHGQDVVEDSTRMSSWVLAKMSHSADGALAGLMSYGRIQMNDGVLEIKEGQESSEGLMGVFKTLGSTGEISRFLYWIATNRSKKIMQKADGARAKAKDMQIEKDDLLDMLKEPDVPANTIRRINRAVKDADKIIKKELDSAGVDERLFTRKEVDEGVKVNKGKTKNGKNRTSLYKDVFTQFQEYRDDVLKIAQDAGIITEENYNIWKDEFYVPFYRVMEEESAAKSYGGSKGLSRQEAYKKMKGGTQDLNDLLENTFMNFQHLLSSSLQNNAAKQAMENGLEVGVTSKTTEEGRDKNSSTFVLENGKKQWYNIEDHLVFEAISSMSDPAANTFSIKLMRKFKRMFTRGITASPQFIIAGGIRDTMHAMAVSNLSYNGFKNFAVGLKDYGTPLHKGKPKGGYACFRSSF